jgi:hypothetical protein
VLPGHSIVALLAVAMTATAATAQLRPRRWTGTAQANGSVLFGNSDQRVLGGRGTLARADSVMRLDLSAQVLYGDTEVDGERREVTKRLWFGALSLDYRPDARVSPFVSATVESSFEKRIAARYSVGVGAKQTFVRTERSEASLSVALLDERTVPQPAAPAPDVTRLTRWSARARVRHALDERLRVSHVTFWQPTARAVSSFLVRSTTEAEYAVTRSMGVSLSLLDSYDSEARARGARVNNDGQLLFGVTGRW